MRDKPGDTEWFDFKGQSGIPLIKAFMESMSWVIREVPLSEITPPKRISRQLKKYHHKNTYFLRSITKRNELLNKVQQPVIDAIIAFIQSVVLFAGYVIAPCGSGKTMMTCRGLKGVQKAIICCPSNQIQEVKNMSSGSVQPFTSQKDIDVIECSIPSLEVQAETLSYLNDLQTQLTSLENLQKQSERNAKFILDSYLNTA